MRKEEWACLGLPQQVIFWNGAHPDLLRNKGSLTSVEVIPKPGCFSSEMFLDLRKRSTELHRHHTISCCRRFHHIPTGKEGACSLLQTPPSLVAVPEIECPLLWWLVLQDGHHQAAPSPYVCMSPTWREDTFFHPFQSGLTYD